MITGAKVIMMELNPHYTPELMNVTLEYKVAEGDNYEQMRVIMSMENAEKYKVGQKLDVMLDASKWIQRSA
jgi:hypothetical protein